MKNKKPPRSMPLPMAQQYGAKLHGEFAELMSRIVVHLGSTKAKSILRGAAAIITKAEKEDGVTPPRPISDAGGSLP